MLKDREIYKNRDEKLVGKENCPFCNIEGQGDCVIWKGKYWYVQHNMFPYLGLKDHIMAIPYTHKVFANELSPDEFAEMSEVQKFIKDFYGNKEYFSFMRETLGKRSIEHLHYQYLPGVLRTSRIENILKEQGF
ncbi:MAG: hypothetical protein PHH06_05595 [Candidatus Gracilibacteria bacterium]|nr:hypothetical protein [Candidatus Gracilibacteria bacterium]